MTIPQMDSEHIELIQKAFDLRTAMMEAIDKIDDSDGPLVLHTCRLLEKDYYFAADLLVLQMHHLITNVGKE